MRATEMPRSWMRWGTCSGGLLLIAAAACAHPSANTMPAPRNASMTASRDLTTDEQVQHVLSRLAFGARPGDADAVRRMGVSAWIERQLDPASIPDTLADHALAGMETQRKRPLRAGLWAINRARSE